MLTRTAKLAAAVLLIAGGVTAKAFAQEYRELAGHNSTVKDVAFSADSRLLATGSVDHTVKLWSVPRGQMIATLTGHERSVYCVAFSPDGKQVASGSSDETVKIWNVATRKEIASLAHEDTIDVVAFSPSSAILATGCGDNVVRLWDASSGKIKFTLAGHRNDVERLAFSPDGALLASGCGRGMVHIWDVANGRELAVFGGPVRVSNLAFSPNGKILASSHEQEWVRLWDVAIWRPLATLRADDDVESLAFAADGKSVICGFRKWDVSEIKPSPAKTGLDKLKVLAIDDGKWSAFNGLPEVEGERLATGVGAAGVFSPDMRFLATPRARTVRLWNIATVQLTSLESPRLRLQIKNARVRVVAVAPDNSFVAAGVDVADGKKTNHTLQVLHLDKSKQSTVEAYSGSVSTIAFSPDGTYLAVGSADAAISLWNIRTRKKSLLKGHAVAPFIDSKKRPASVRLIRFSPDGRSLVSVGKMDAHTWGVIVWDAATGRSKKKFNFGRFNQLVSAHYSPDGKLLAIGNYKGMLQLYDTSNFRKVGAIQGKRDTAWRAFMPEGKAILFAEGNRVALCDLASGKELNEIGRGWAPVISPDGTTAVLGNSLRNMASGDQLGHLEDVGSATFSPDGTLLVGARSFNDDAEILVFDSHAYADFSYGEGVAPVAARTLASVLRKAGYVGRAVKLKAVLSKADGKHTASISLPNQAWKEADIVAEIRDALQGGLPSEQFGEELRLQICDEDFAVKQTWKLELSLRVERRDETGAYPHGAPTLVGIWKTLSLRHDGDKIEFDNDKHYVFDDAKMAVQANGKTVSQLAYHVNNKTTPGELDLILTKGDEKKTSPMIYKFEGDRLTICYPVLGNPRPTDFTTNEGDRRTLLVLQRVSE